MVHHHGKLIDREEIANITPGSHNKEDVFRLLGTPSTTATFDSNTWYYISKITEAKAFFAPKTTEQDVYVVEFDDSGIVKNIIHRGVEDSQEVVYVNRITPTTGQSTSFMQQIFGNFGRISRQKDNLSQK